jgi:hypothetical protein
MQDLEKCKKWLVNFLCDDERIFMPVEEVRKTAKEQGFYKHLKQARREVGVETDHQFDAHGVGQWFWWLPCTSEHLYEQYFEEEE